MTISNTKVDDFFSDLALSDPEKQRIAVALRTEIKRQAKTAEERVMYGGILYFLDQPFCGIFSYKSHVTLEFSNGYQFEDKAGVLEGSGKLRRHIKFKQASEIIDKHTALYIEQAIRLAQH